MALVLIQHRVFYEAYRFSIHAEQDCIVNCPKKYLNKKSIMVIFRHKGEHIDSCTKCKALLGKYGIKVYCAVI
jgi:cytidine deaminase